MDQKIKVSVILPVYNGEAYLRKCMDDILAQTLKEIQVICINDGSADSTLEILREYAAADDRVLVIDQENTGAGQARNNGLVYAEGEYLSFLDADDFFEPQMLEKAYQSAVSAQADITVFRGDRYDDTLERFVQMDYSVKTRLLPGKNPFSFHDLPDSIFTVFVGWAWDKLYRRDFVMEDEKLRFQNLRTSNDLFFVFSSLTKARKIYVADELLVHHRIHVKGSLSVTRERSWSCFYQAAKALQEELLRTGVYQEVEKGFLNWILHFAFWNLDTIEGEGYEKVYDLICGDCMRDFDWFSHEREYYKGNLALYDRLKVMREKTCLEYLLDHYRASEAEIQKLKEQKKRTEERLKETQRENEEIRRSTTFRVGRAVTAVPRKAKSLLRGEKNA
ncbi:MAG: glycosyltransferase family 2 protein [Candidatus Limivivens sp.]|nr:glycosyltransferase family 2 protein [Candidatus Limivivens sp.]